MVALIVLVGLGASAAMYQITAQGPGVDPDSTVYIEAAQALLGGKGVFVQGQPLTHYPPAYPLLLAFVGLFTGGDILWAARLLGAFLFGANVVLLALAVCVCTRYSFIATGCAILLFLVSKPIMSMHAMAWSEAPFVAFSLAGLILLSAHIVRPRLRYLVWASLMVGAAAATRYVGVTLLPTAALALFLLTKQSVRKKVADIILFSGLACLPLGSWVIRNVLVAQSATNREPAFHPCNFSHVKNLIGRMYDFVLPISVSGWTKAFHVGVAVILLVLAATLLHRRISTKRNGGSIGLVLPLILVIYSAVYVMSLFLSISFFDAHTPVNKRLLLPVYLALIVVVTSYVRAFSQAWPQKEAWHGYVVLVFFSVSINAVPALSTAVDLHANGTGYTARYWRDSATLGYLSHVPETMTVYSNGRDTIHFLTGKETNAIPRKVFPCTGKENASYPAQMRQMIAECREGKALIVYFDRITWRWYFPSRDEIEDLSTMPVAAAMDDGIIYGIAVEKDSGAQDAAADRNSMLHHPHP